MFPPLILRILIDYAWEIKLEHVKTPDDLLKALNHLRKFSPFSVKWEDASQGSYPISNYEPSMLSQRVSARGASKDGCLEILRIEGEIKSTARKKEVVYFVIRMQYITQDLWKSKFFSPNGNTFTFEYISPSPYHYHVWFFLNGDPKCGVYVSNPLKEDSFSTIRLIRNVQQ